MAEAGVGKSRLLYELRKIISNEDITFLEGKCLSYSRNVPYHPVLDILKANFNIEDDDEEKIIVLRGEDTVLEVVVSDEDELLIA